MIVQALLVICGVAGAVVCVVSGQPTAGALIGSVCASLFFLTMM